MTKKSKLIFNKYILIKKIIVIKSLIYLFKIFILKSIMKNKNYFKNLIDLTQQNLLIFSSFVGYHHYPILPTLFYLTFSLKSPIIIFIIDNK